MTDFKKEGKIPSPSEFMRARRPHLFSDSRTQQQSILPQPIFEYYLETITNRKQEVDFEYFCRKLTEKEICPNLLPQTGPTGGGDSKVDSETYPVSDEIAMCWYESINTGANKERWAFAYSAKKKWEPKLREDIKKITETKREYTKAFFISNQYIPDKKRSAIEDELRKVYGIDIRILDRNWILDKVYTNNRIELAIETLKIQGYEVNTKKITGQRDYGRENELSLLDKQIEDVERYKGVQYQLAEDCLESAFLARGLERTRTEVEGRFIRALKIAEKAGYVQQQMRILYHLAWTEYWWYEDYLEFNRLYDQVEQFAISLNSAHELELLHNLLMILATSVRNGKLMSSVANLNERERKLRTGLSRLMADKTRPNNALQAETTLLFMDLNGSLFANKSPDKVFVKLKHTIQRSINSLDYPLEQVFNLIDELGEYFPDNEKYDKLYDSIIELCKIRSSEGETGKLLLKNGLRKLKNKPYEAIKLLGKALQLLAQEGYHSSWIVSLAGSAIAYENIGLLWAARANMIVAANQALTEFWKDGKITIKALRTVQRLVWLEIQLGRIFPALEYIRLESILANQLLREEVAKQKYEQERLSQEVALSILFLQLDVWELKHLDFLPDILDSLGLFLARTALLYALGYEDQLRKDGSIPADETPETAFQFFESMLKQPVGGDLPGKIDLGYRSSVNLETYVFGCNVIVKTENTTSSIFLSETILSSLESFLATGLEREVGIMPYLSELKVFIKTSNQLKEIPTYEFAEDECGLKLTIEHEDKWPFIHESKREGFKTWLLELLFQITFKIAMVTDKKLFTKKKILAEMVGRSIYHSGFSVAIENILGQNPKLSLTDWEKEEVQHKYPLRRDIEWYPKAALNMEELKLDEDQNIKIGEGDPPKELLFGLENLKHKDIFSSSIINRDLWDQAGWTMVGYMYTLSKPQEVITELPPPVLLLGFTNVEPAILQFKQWIKKFGKIDKDENIRIAIIKGINKSYPLNYRVTVSNNIKLHPGRYSFTSVRIHEMTPRSSEHRDIFFQQYKQVGRYLLTPAFSVLENGQVKEMTPYFEYAIGKKELHFREAWQIGEHDPDAIVFKRNDKPIIPSGEKNVPAINAIERARKKKHVK
ncbi:MAG: hypothetical protein IAE93_15355 [Ignavibacteria bacterium]|nr:hypothetical protein [Ignavibacteria bacterium]